MGTQNSDARWAPILQSVLSSTCLRPPLRRCDQRLFNLSPGAVSSHAARLTVETRRCNQRLSGDRRGAVISASLPVLPMAFSCRGGITRRCNQRLPPVSLCSTLRDQRGAVISASHPFFCRARSSVAGHMHCARTRNRVGVEDVVLARQFGVAGWQLMLELGASDEVTWTMILFGGHMRA